MAANVKRKSKRAYIRRRRRLGAILAVFVLVFALCIFLVIRATVSLAYETVDLAEMVNITFSGYSSNGTAALAFDDSKLNELLSTLKSDYDEAFFHDTHPEDADYALFRQSLKCEVSKSEGLSNGEIVSANCTYDEELAKKLKLDITGTSRQFTVSGLSDMTRISVDDVFSGLSVSFEGTSPNLTISLVNNNSNPLVSKMIFEILDPKEYYASGDTVRVHAIYTDEMCMETKYLVDAPQEDCVREYVAESDSSYVSCADELPLSILQEAVSEGKKAFKDANEYGVRIYCEANLVPVYINKKATFEYGTPKYVSSYFKTVFPEKAGKLGLSYNDLDIIYEVKITQADGVSCKAYAAVRFSDIVKNSDNSYSYDFSNPKILSESYFSERVKANVTDSYVNTHTVERVYL